MTRVHCSLAGHIGLHVASDVTGQHKAKIAAMDFQKGGGVVGGILYGRFHCGISSLTNCLGSESKFYALLVISVVVTLHVVGERR